MQDLRVCNFTELLTLVEGRKVIIFGAGNRGYKLCKRMRENISKLQIAFCDNNPQKQGTEILECKVYSVENAVKQYHNAIFVLISETSIDYVTEMSTQLLKYIDKKQIVVIQLSSLYIMTKEQQLNNSKRFFYNLLVQQKPLERFNEVKEIKSIVFRNRCLNGTGGGPAKVLSVQETALGYELDNMKLSYKYKIENDISLEMEYVLGNCLGAIEFARLLCEYDRQVVYVVHDIFSACGLALSGKHYVLVYHSQGETVFEWKNMGRSITQEEEKIIKQIESISIQKASYVCFPSKGAEIYFRESWGLHSVPRYSKGAPLYNCLAQEDLLIHEKVDGLQREDKCFTILSIGQMTLSKGMDRIPEFLNRLSSEINREIRWIVVAEGPLKKEVLCHMEQLSSENKNLSYLQFNKLPHSQINYLFSISNAYLMLHRVSIFDFATLEAMYNNLIIMLSDIPGNQEYNLHNNIIMVSEDADYKYIAEQIQTYRRNNREVYDKEFSMDKFRRRYKEMICSMIKKSMRETPTKIHQEEP